MLLSQPTNWWLNSRLVGHNIQFGWSRRIFYKVTGISEKSGSIAHYTRTSSYLKWYVWHVYWPLLHFNPVHHFDLCFFLYFVFAVIGILVSALYLYGIYNVRKQQNTLINLTMAVENRKSIGKKLMHRIYSERSKVANFNKKRDKKPFFYFYLAISPLSTSETSVPYLKNSHISIDFFCFRWSIK